MPVLTLVEGARKPATAGTRMTVGEESLEHDRDNDEDQAGKAR
jgi:hypothetical protein